MSHTYGDPRRRPAGVGGFTLYDSWDDQIEVGKIRLDLRKLSFLSFFGERKALDTEKITKDRSRVTNMWMPSRYEEFSPEHVGKFEQKIDTSLRFRNRPAGVNYQE